jgi:4-aminobutyrate aminotransferase/(S)-3-amino-2-methylpropionate transaminase
MQWDVGLLVDEVQTGCGTTGKMWCHENYNLDGPPDIVTFSKKMLTGGFYLAKEYRPPQGYRVFNTWMGDPGKMLLLEAVLQTIKKDNLLENVRSTGKYVLDGIEALQAKYPQVLNSARGLGFIIAVNCYTGQRRDKFVHNLRLKGWFLSIYTAP